MVIRKKSEASQLLFADDTALVVDNWEKLQNLVPVFISEMDDRVKILVKSVSLLYPCCCMTFA